MLSEALASAGREPLTAGEIMSRPARFVSPEDTIARAMALCQRHRQSGIQVGNPQRLIGVVTRRPSTRPSATGCLRAGEGRDGPRAGHLHRG